MCGGDLSEGGRWKNLDRSTGNELVSVVAAVSYDTSTIFRSVMCKFFKDESLAFKPLGQWASLNEVDQCMYLNTDIFQHWKALRPDP